MPRRLLPLLLLLVPLTALASPQADEVYQLLQRLAGLLAAPRSTPQTFYVSPGGNNANSCDLARNPATPKATLNGSSGGIACLQSGDTLVLRDGLYREQIGDTQGEAPGSTRPPSGTSWEALTTIKAEHPRKATLELPQGHGHVVMLGLADTRYLSIEGLVLDATGRGTCVWVGPSSYIRFKDNVIKNCGGNGVMGSVADDGTGCQGIQLVGNEIFNIAVGQVGDPGTHAIYFTGSQSLIQGNYIHAPCPYYGIHATSEHGGLYQNVIENNRVVGCDQAGIFSQGRETLIRNNLVENNCIGIYLSAGATAVLHNTIYGWHAAKCSDNYGIFNKSGGSTLGNNLILAQQTSIYNTQATTLTSNMCDSGQSVCQRNVPAAGIVIDGPGGNLQLVPSGPAVDAATPASAVPVDRLGVTRPQGTAPDIGAYESTGTAPPNPNPPADTTKPQATLTTPLAGSQLTGTVTLTATASDNVGIAGLQFLLDGQNLGPELHQPPWQYAWNTSTTTPGAHTLSVSVRDQANNFGKSAGVPVTVVGSTPPPATSLTCSGQLAAVPGRVSLTCTPQTGDR